MGPAAFEDVLVRLDLRVRQALRLTADRNYKIHRSPDPNALEMYKKVIQECMGEGHQEFLGALLRCLPGAYTDETLLSPARKRCSVYDMTVIVVSEKPLG